MHRTLLTIAASALVLVGQASAQSWDLPARLGSQVEKETNKQLKLAFEERTRVESRQGVSFGKDPDQDYGLFRTRFGMTYQPNKHFKISGMVQDTRAPYFGPGAATSLREGADMQEGYIEINPDSRTGFGMTAGRMMLNYGEARLLGSPQWTNVTRTWDQARVFWRTGVLRAEVLMLAPVKVRADEFNFPVFGDRIWGTYNTLPKMWRKSATDLYFLRHEQNRPGGFTSGNRAAGTDRMGVNTFGGRWTGPLAEGWKYSVEGALQNGKIGPASHRGGAWFSAVNRRWQPAKHPLDTSFEYKYASGTANPSDALHSGTFDQLYPANHDKLGHEDLIGWKNIHNVRGLATYGLTKSLSVNFMYDSYWLASARDSLYNGQGKSIARSASGTAGTHVGQETDVFLVWKLKRMQFGGGYGHFISGEFIRQTTPGVGPNYFYVFQSYTL